MTWSPTPWFVGGGAEHSPELARAMLNSATGGTEGVGSLTDLKVRAASTPSATVVVGTGVGMMLNRYAGGNDRQSYMGFNQSDTNTVISATSGTGRSDLIVARVIDPQYGDAAPPSVPNGPYVGTAIIPNVPSTTTTFSQLGLNYPAIEIARIDIPPNTGTITNAMIVDLRKLAQPRTMRQLYTLQFVLTYKLTASGGAYQTWIGNPVGYSSGIPIPSWATRVVARFDVEQGTVGNASAIAAGYGSGAGFGRIGAFNGSVGVTALRTAETVWRWDAGTVGTRSSVGFADTLIIPSTMRGTNQSIGVDAKWFGNLFPYIDVNSYGVYDLEFIERI